MHLEILAIYHTCDVEYFHGVDNTLVASKHTVTLATTETALPKTKRYLEKLGASALELSNRILRRKLTI